MTRVEVTLPQLTITTSGCHMSHTFSESHAHVYFTEDTQQYATDLYNRLETTLPTVKVEPFMCVMLDPIHLGCLPCHSTKLFQKVVLWLMTHLDGLSALVHPLSGDDLRDHTQYAMWFGKQLDLYLDKRKVTVYSTKPRVAYAGRLESQNNLVQIGVVILKLQSRVTYPLRIKVCDRMKSLRRKSK